MMKINVKYMTLFALLFSLYNSATAAVTDIIRGNAKFNVVVIVLLIIFIGIAVFLFWLDRRISKLEKKHS